MSHLTSRPANMLQPQALSDNLGMLPIHQWHPAAFNVGNTSIMANSQQTHIFPTNQLYFTSVHDHKYAPHGTNYLQSNPLMQLPKNDTSTYTSALWPASEVTRYNLITLQHANIAATIPYDKVKTVGQHQQNLESPALYHRKTLTSSSTSSTPAQYPLLSALQIRTHDKAQSDSSQSHAQPLTSDDFHKTMPRGHKDGTNNPFRSCLFPNLSNQISNQDQPPPLTFIDAPTSKDRHESHHSIDNTSIVDNAESSVIVDDKCPSNNELFTTTRLSSKANMTITSQRASSSAFKRIVNTSSKIDTNTAHQSKPGDHHRHAAQSHTWSELKNNPAAPIIAKRQSKRFDSEMHGSRDIR